MLRTLRQSRLDNSRDALMTELCTIDLSAIYIDVSKDTIYIEAPASRARRSAQTAMYEIARGLWHVFAGDASVVFDPHTETVWSGLIGRLPRAQ